MTSSLCASPAQKRVHVGEQRVEHLLRRFAAVGVRAGDQAIVGELFVLRRSSPR